MIAGTRVQTKFGPGKILGWEWFSEGKSAPLSETYQGYRACVELDNPENWVGRSVTPNPYFLYGELTPLPQEVVIKARIETNWPFPPFPNLKDMGNRVPKFNPNNHEDAPL